MTAAVPTSSQAFAEDGVGVRCRGGRPNPFFTRASAVPVFPGWGHEVFGIVVDFEFQPIRLEGLAGPTQRRRMASRALRTPKY